MFYSLNARNLGRNFILVATTAVCEAFADGVFVAGVKRTFGCSIRVLPEMRKVGKKLWVSSAGLQRHGVSQVVQGAESQFYISLERYFRKSDIWALDRIRVGEDSNRNLKKARSLVAQNLNSISWLASRQGALFMRVLCCVISVGRSTLAIKKSTP